MTLERSSPVADAIIVNWNGSRYLPGCLAALASSAVPVRVLVVDNASSDGSVEYLREHQVRSLCVWNPAV